MNQLKQLCEDYYRIEKALAYLNLNFNKNPGLKELAEHINLSEFHFQRLFTRWVGISPKKFIQHLTIDALKKNMDSSRSLLSITYDCGLSSPSRLHDIFINLEGITPGEYKKMGADLTIFYDIYDSPFGEYLLGATAKGICNLIFLTRKDQLSAVEELKKFWPQSRIEKSKTQTENYTKKLFTNFNDINKLKRNLILKGTAFQYKVWKALLEIPAGKLISYKDVSLMLGMPQSVRAVANAIAKNPIAFIIPCHRVLRGSGHLGGYRWGLERKSALIGWESSH